MAETGDFPPQPPLGTVGWYQAQGTAVPAPYDDGLGVARANLDRTITALSEKIDKDRDSVSFDDLLTLANAMGALVDARMELDR